MVERCGLRSHFLERGQGPLVVLLHSAGLGAGQWRALMGALEGRFRLVAPNMLGYGRSSPWPDDQDMALAAELDLLDVLLDVRLGDVGGDIHLVGHSLGAWLAMGACRRHPGRFASLTLIEPVALGLLHTGDEAAARDEVGAMIDDFLQYHAAGNTAAAMERFTDYWYGAGAWASLPAAQRLPIFARAAKMAADVRGAWADRTPVEAYAAAIERALILNAERTSFAARRMAALLAAAIPGARVRQIGGAGHLAPATHAADVAAILLDALPSTQS